MKKIKKKSYEEKQEIQKPAIQANLRTGRSSRQEPQALNPFKGTERQMMTNHKSNNPKGAVGEEETSSILREQGPTAQVTAETSIAIIIQIAQDLGTKEKISLVEVSIMIMMIEPRTQKTGTDGEGDLRTEAKRTT